MHPELKSRKYLGLVAALTLVVLCGGALFFGARGTAWIRYDYNVLDFFYKLAVKRGRGPGPSFTPPIVYLLVTDDTYDFFGKNYLDRRDMARVNEALSELDPQAVAYDIVFARASNREADERFAESLELLGCAYLPAGFAFRDGPGPFQWKEGVAYERLRSDYLGRPEEKGTPRPRYARKALVQHAPFARAARGSGDISILADPDGVYRHASLLIKIDEESFPTLGLAVFLDWAGASLDRATLEWGKRMVVPALEGGWLEEDLIVPVDERGRVYIPFVDEMGEDFTVVTVHKLLEYFQDEDLRGNLADIFEGSFVFVGDVAAGVADLGNTPLEKSAPLVILHASLLNAMLTRTFYGKWPLPRVLGLVGLVALALGAASCLKSSWWIYLSGPSILAGLVWLTWWEFVHFRLFPLATVGSVAFLNFFGLVAVLEIASSGERAFIRNTFARYVPEKVVRELLARPEALRLGGEERVLTVLFSDLADFTSISEKMSPAALVELLNEYLSAMTDIVLEEGGIIDKYEGDAIMAEFGVPLPLENHADRAVAAALGMQRRLGELREAWKRRGLPALHCRVGINTGAMVVGNMGSKTVLDYTVMGDAVNLASRLEGANKDYGTSVMISRFTYESLTPGRFLARPLDRVKVKGKTRPVKVYEVYGRCGDPVSPWRERYYEIYEEALEAYLAGDYGRAKEMFQEALALFPGDAATLRVLAKMEADAGPDAVVSAAGA